MDVLAGLSAVASVIVAIVSAGIAVGALRFARKQAAEAKKAREISAIVPLYQAHEAVEFSDVRRGILHAFEHDIPFDHNRGSETQKLHLHHYINHLNFTCSMVTAGLVDSREAKLLFGMPVIQCWSA